MADAAAQLPDATQGAPAGVPDPAPATAAAVVAASPAAVVAAPMVDHEPARTASTAQPPSPWVPIAVQCTGSIVLPIVVLAITLIVAGRRQRQERESRREKDREDAVYAIAERIHRVRVAVQRRATLLRRIAELDRRPTQAIREGIVPSAAAADLRKQVEQVDEERVQNAVLLDVDRMRAARMFGDKAAAPLSAAISAAIVASENGTEIDSQFLAVFAAIRTLMQKPET